MINKQQQQRAALFQMRCMDVVVSCPRKICGGTDSWTKQRLLLLLTVAVDLPFNALNPRQESILICPEALLLALVRSGFARITVKRRIILHHISTQPKTNLSSQVSMNAYYQ